MITLTSPSPDKQRIQGHKLGFSQLTQNPVSALVYMSYQPDLNSGVFVSAVLAELNGNSYDQIHILALIESDKHNRIELSKTLLKLYNLRPYSAIYADIETLKWFNSDQQFTNLAEQEKELHGWKDYPAVMGVGRYQLKNTPAIQAEAQAWQSTVLDQVESMKDSNNEPVLRYVKKIETSPAIMDKFTYRGKNTAIDALAGACHVMLSIADDLRWQYLGQ
jgi:hypothetical protein